MLDNNTFFTNEDISQAISRKRNRIREELSTEFKFIVKDKEVLDKLDSLLEELVSVTYEDAQNTLK